MSRSITQDMAYRQSLMKYTEKYDVSRASRQYNKSRSYIYFWKQRWDGSVASLACQSRRARRACHCFAWTTAQGCVRIQIEWPEVGGMNVELLKMGLLLLVGFLFGGYHFDDQVLISERLSGHHRVKLKNTRVLKVFLFLRDKNQRSYFSTVAVCLQIYAYLLGIANFLLAAVIRTRAAVDIVLYIDYGFGLLGMFAIVFFGAFYSMKRKK